MVFSLSGGLGISAFAEDLAENAVTEEIIPATETEDEKTVYTAYITEEESLDGQAHKEPMPDMKLRDAKALALPTILSVVPSDINGIPAQIDVFKRTSGSSWNPTVTYELYLPGNVVPYNCYFSWEGGLQATVNGDTYDSGECPVPSPGQTASYAFSYNNRNATFRVTTYQGSPNVAPIFIVIDESLGTIAAMDGDIDHNAECQGIIFIDGTQHVLSKMKGRGNATWTGSDDKKPYNLTLGSKTNILGIDSAKTKKWSILAEITDHSLLCNRSGFMLAHQLGVGQDTASADVWMNGEYQGCYTVTPKYDSFVNKNGFLIEEDNYLEDPVASGGDPQFTLTGLKEASGWSSCYNRITVKEIGDNLLEQYGNDKQAVANAIQVWLQDAWDAIRSDNGYNSKGGYYTDYIDVESFAKMYIMHEYVKSYDVCAGSILFHREGMTDSDKLIAGPAWDYDNAMGSTCYNGDLENNLSSDERRNSAQGSFIPNINEYKTSIFKTLGKHDDFMQEVYRQYKRNSGYFDSLPENVQSLINSIELSAMMNHYKVNPIEGPYKNVHDYNSNTNVGTGQYAQSYLATNDDKSDWPNYAQNLKTYVTIRSLWFRNNIPTVEDKVTVTFDSDGGSAVEAQIIDYGGTATEPEAPVKSGYVFSGWTLNGEAYSFSTPVTGNIELLASWTEAVAKNTSTGVEYADVSDALSAAGSGETVLLLKDCSDDMAMVPSGRTLDLSGKTLTTEYLSAFNNSNVIDSSDHAGLLACSNVTLNKDNSQMPVKTEGGYKLFTITAWQRYGKRTNDTDHLHMQTRPYPGTVLDHALNYTYLGNGSTTAGISLEAKLTYRNSQGSFSHTSFVYNDDHCRQVYDGVGANAFYVDFTGMDKLTDVSLTTVITSETGVVWTPSSEYTCIPKAVKS